MLRYFIKIRGLTEVTDNTGAKIISNYNVKTLMLWACELKPRSWWTDGVNVVRICVELFHTLAVWLTDARCQHYFISNCNLMDRVNKSNSSYVQIIVMNIAPVSQLWLAEWFTDNYIQKCARLWPGFASALFDNISTRTDTEKAVSAVVQLRFITSPLCSYRSFTAAQQSIIQHVSEGSLTVRLCLQWMTELAKLDRDLNYYFTAVTFLHAGRKITTNLLDDKLLDVLATICLQSNDLRRCRNARHSSMLSLSQAAMLMKVVANNSRSTVQLIEIELSKAYLYRVLRCKDSDSDSIYCLANIYLAVLYYTTGQYQPAIDHCTLVTRSQDHSRCSSHVVQGELLPKIDDEIDNILGLAVFYQYVRTATSSQQHQNQHVSVFTTELFAHYLCVRCLLVTQCPKLTSTPLTSENRRCQDSLCELSEMFVTDVLAFKSVHTAKYPDHLRQVMFVEAQTKPVTSVQLDTSELVELLQQSAVEHLTMSRQLEAQKFGHVAVIVTTDYDALYAYRCGEYQRCLQLSATSLHALIFHFSPMSMVFSYLEFIPLMDDDIASLIGLMLIVNPSCRDSTNGNISISPLTLSLYLVTQCQLKLHHSVTALVQTLNYIVLACRKLGYLYTSFDLLLFKLTERKILMHTSEVSRSAVQIISVLLYYCMISP